MKEIVYDKNGKLCAAKTAFWIVLLTMLYKIIMQETPDYAGMSVFLSPVAATYLGRAWTKNNDKSEGIK